MVGIRRPTTHSRIRRLETGGTMTSPSAANIERLAECLTAINLKLSFWFDQDHFETDEEVEEVIHYCESGEMDEFTDTCVDEFLSMIHEHFFDPPYQSPLGHVDRPMGVTLDSNITYD